MKLEQSRRKSLILKLTKNLHKIILVKGWAYKSTENNIKSTNKPSHLWSIEFQYWGQDKYGKNSLFQQSVLDRKSVV